MIRKIRKIGSENRRDDTMEERQMVDILVLISTFPQRQEAGPMPRGRTGESLGSLHRMLETKGGDT